ncbi:MAG: hypothetical protein ABSD77_06300 [Verrucomicrobiota bacterium]
MPADAEFFDHGIRFLQPEPGHGSVQRLLDEMFERNVQTAHRGLRLGGFQPGGFRRDGVFAVVKLNVSRDFGNRPDCSQAILRMANRHADMEGFDFHAENLTMDEHG